MAKIETNAGALAAQLVKDARKGVFSSIYVLMGDEPYYIDMVCDALIETVVPEEDLKDFCQTVAYASDLSPEAAIAQARLYPMMGERQLVVVKDIQNWRTLDDIIPYIEDPADFTVLVLTMRGKTLDKRKALYKLLSQKATVLESMLIKENKVVDWIISYYKSLGLAISPDAASLLAENVGTNLTKIASDTDKLRKSLPEDIKNITIEDVEKNVGVSREFSVFELNKALAYRNGKRALTLTTNIGSAAKFALPMATALLYAFFYKVLKWQAYAVTNPGASSSEKAASIGVNPYFAGEYEAAARNYPLPKLVKIVELLKEYDFMGKGGNGFVATTDKDLFIDLITKILC